MNNYEVKHNESGDSTYKIPVTVEVGCSDKRGQSLNIGGLLFIDIVKRHNKNDTWYELEIVPNQLLVKRTYNNTFLAVEDILDLLGK
jgi:hypothetical protein